MIYVGLNPYGIAYCNGLMAQETPRANPQPNTLEQYITLAKQIGARGIEMDIRQLSHLDETGLARLRDQLDELRFFRVLSQCPPIGQMPASVRLARAIGVKVIRMHLTPVLCGDRAECNWAEMLTAAQRELTQSARIAAGHNIDLAIEDHQDFTSTELIELCETCGPNVGITLDTGNALSVGEDPVAFARTIAPRVRHVHLKDYRAHWSDEGYRLVRCPIGDGAIPFKQVLEAVDSPNGITACIEPGALSARHIRLLSRSWWKGYPPRDAASLAAGLKAARVRRLSEADDWRTPWEKDAPAGEIIEYEMRELHRSVDNLRAMGLM